MTLILSGTNGLSDVDGSAATPAIRGTDANTGIFFPAADTIAFSEGGVEAMRLDSSGNLGLGVIPSAWNSAYRGFELGKAGNGVYGWSGGGLTGLVAGAYLDSSFSWKYALSSQAIGKYEITETGKHLWSTAPSGTAGNAISFTQAMTLTAGGQLLVGTTSGIGSNTSVVVKGTSAGEQQLTAWSATTSGDPYFAEFATEASYTARGSIRYNRATGLTNYNTTSDYRAKYIIGPVTDSGSLIDSVPVYMGKMKGATQERPMFIAHEVPAYAHTGEKDAVDADGKPVYQQMDASALVPVLWAELKSLRARVAQLEAK